ncbi:hypothetical protein S2091_1537 [Solimicrobium silvestre]|uniref:Uncharacterized protein n=1 Tax=Solimicrobium silvestre TaxID=2099400 RepID=A0A2S9H1T8_9BURK|nr:hypothetical protein S2091_1537 [Solimicrobium silvestre]
MCQRGVLGDGGCSLRGDPTGRTHGLCIVDSFDLQTSGIVDVLRDIAVAVDLGIFAAQRVVEIPGGDAGGVGTGAQASIGIVVV